MSTTSEAPSSKRAGILALYELRACAADIITVATTPFGGLDYERRLRMWAADCASRAVHLIEDDFLRRFAIDFIEAAPTLATSPPETSIGNLPLKRLYADTRSSACAPNAEARLAACLAVHPNVYVVSANFPAPVQVQPDHPCLHRA